MLGTEKYLLINLDNVVTIRIFKDQLCIDLIEENMISFRKNIEEIKEMFESAFKENLRAVVIKEPHNFY